MNSGRRALNFGRIAAPLALSLGIAANANSQAKPAAATCSIRNSEFIHKKSDGSTTRIPGIISKGQKIRKIRCMEEGAAILTDSELIAVDDAPKKPKKEGNTTAAFQYGYSRYDISDISRRKMVSWTLAEDRAVILTRDGMITMLPYQNGVKNMKVVRLHYDVRGAKTAYHAGLVFAGPMEGKIAVCSFGKKPECMTGKTGIVDQNQEFFMLEDQLYFGTLDGSRLRIAAGKGLQSVRILPQ